MVGPDVLADDYVAAKFPDYDFIESFYDIGDDFFFTQLDFLTKIKALTMTWV